MTEEVLSFAKDAMSKSLDSLKKEYLTIRTGKINITVLDGIMVPYHEAMMPLNQVASVLVVDATTISINPWEKQILRDVESALLEANLGVTPTNDGEVIKLFFPPMNKEQREVGVKQAKTITEKFKVSVRNVRREANDKIKKLEKNKDITVDDSKKAQTDIQKMTDEFIAKFDEALKFKEKDIMTI